METICKKMTKFAKKSFKRTNSGDSLTNYDDESPSKLQMSSQSAWNSKRRRGGMAATEMERDLKMLLRILLNIRMKECNIF